MNEPSLVAVAGDWHGNAKWAVSAIRQMCARLPEPRIILHAGDFGVWPDDGTFMWIGELRHRQTYLEAVSEALETANARLWFVDGNHEDHPYLASLTEGMRDDDACVAYRISHLRRGYRWTWHGKRWLALGGAVSVDKLARREGKDWFPQEAITDEQEASVIAAGPADVLLSHDAPRDAPMVLMRPPPALWAPVIPSADAHRDRMQRICETVKPSYVFHGHYHQDHIYDISNTRWGECRFTALNMDGTQHNWGILDTETMEWEW